jgi:hypothetical protein
MPSFITPPLDELPLGLPGQISRLGSFVVTRTLNQVAGLAAGVLVGPSGTTGQECASPATEAHVASAIGFSCYRAMSADFDATHHYEDNEAVAIMESGHMYVLAEGTCVADEPVYVRIASDGGDNTVLGKVLGSPDAPAGAVVITPEASLVQAVTFFELELSDGDVTESFVFESDATPTPTEVATGLVALIDASDKFAATGTTTISVTSTTGVVTVVSSNEQLDVTTAAPAARGVLVPGTFFDASRTGAGLVEIRRIKIN